jgi:hypothetical protein
MHSAFPDFSRRQSGFGRSAYGLAKNDLTAAKQKGATSVA